ncbi:Thaumatin-like protein [Vitis vinifera]|uniref:Thaumatin-like protein n=1 Tax=Vitis vinifera TaxID=29760 RepID=A0A438FLR0_VITVI|nr:Thaumatin-like protein [Vitis vinifera]
MHQYPPKSTLRTYIDTFLHSWDCWGFTLFSILEREFSFWLHFVSHCHFCLILPIILHIYYNKQLPSYHLARHTGGSGTPQLPTTGLQLESGQSIRIPTSPGWSGRIWARTGCTFDESGAGTCQTGDCGGRLECDGIGAAPPTSLFEITLGAGTDKDFYDVSFVDGYNLPLIAVPRGVYGGCNATGCASDINIGCPKELQVVGNSGEEGGVVACKSACDAFGLDQYCCSGEFANPSTCRPSFYSSIFKRACPRAYSYAFDDGTSTFTCKAYEYAVIFCPNANGMKRSNDPLPGPLFQGRNNGEIGG